MRPLSGKSRWSRRGKAASYNSGTMSRSPKEMGEAIARNLPEKTGRTFAQWVAIAKKSGLTGKRELVAWLKSEHQIGHVTAVFIAAEAMGKSIGDTYADEGALLENLFAG